MVEIGEESNREMCVPFFYYYPKQEAGAFQSYYPPECEQHQLELSNFESLLVD